MNLRIASAVAACLFSATAAFAAGGQGADDTTKPSSQLQMAMALYAGGISLGNVDMDATFRGDDYHVVSNLTTSGVVNVLWQSHIQATSTGKISGGHVEPALYDSFYTGRNVKNQEISLTYENGQPRLYANPPYPLRGYEVPPEQQKNTFDPMSTVIALTTSIRADSKNPCGVTLPVFDGRRRYDISFTKEKDADIKMDNGIYKGHVQVCAIKYNQISGFSPGVLKAKQKFPPIHAWVATFPAAEGRTYAIPLRVWADTEYGTIAALVNKLVIDGTPQKAS
ncbi:MAG TPA: DUF3108 domain-containing protein [Rhizomicrobium sp.]|jgi:hypothetical protein